MSKPTQSNTLVFDCVGFFVSPEDRFTKEMHHSHGHTSS
jgi:hypothetical protein